MFNRMLSKLKEMQNYTRTENGAVTYASTMSDCLDLFATIGALRNAEDSEVIERFLRAYAEDPDIAMKTFFYARDVRGGLGERKVARTILKWLANNHPESVIKNIELVAEYGRYDDLLVLLDTSCRENAIELIKKQLVSDEEAMMEGKAVSLLAKWLPSVNASNAQTVKMAKNLAGSLGMTEKEYRKLLTALRAEIKLLENNLREKDYSFDYAKQPSKALFKYRQAFQRNDRERYLEFLNKVSEGKVKMHTGTLTPYDIIAPIVQWGRVTVTAEDKRAMDVTWKAQEDFTGGENALVVVDGSGSMYGGGSPLPAAVAQSLAIYFAERNKGAFRNHFITFSANPRLVKVKGRDIFEKVQYCESFNEVANTNIKKVFDLVLQTAIVHRIPQKEMPAYLYIITDMEFDSCAQDASVTNFEYAKKRFARHGYRLPHVVFWNVNSRSRQQPVEMNEQGVTLVSGCSPRIFSMIASKTLTPYEFMMDTLNGDRYKDIVA